MAVMPTLTMLMANGLAKPSLMMYLMEVKLIAKKTLVPNNARCALVVGFNGSLCFGKVRICATKKPSLDKDGCNTK